MSRTNDEGHDAPIRWTSDVPPARIKPTAFGGSVRKIDPSLGIPDLRLRERQLYAEMAWEAFPASEPYRFEGADLIRAEIPTNQNPSTDWGGLSGARR